MNFSTFEIKILDQKLFAQKDGFRKLGFAPTANIRLGKVQLRVYYVRTSIVADLAPTILWYVCTYIM